MLSILQLKCNSSTEVTREPDPDDRWDNGCTRTDWYVYGVRRLAADAADTVMIPYDVPVGTKVYCVWAVWNTGDSFGSYEGAHMEFIDVFFSEEKAKACVEALGSYAGEDYNKYTVNYTREDGSIIPFHRPWLGYFESLDTLTYESFEVEDGNPT